MSAPLLKRRTVVLTASAVAITAVGAYTGAQLKTDADVRAKVAKARGEGVDVKIQRLVDYRDGLERRRVELEAKILRLEAKDENRVE